MSKIFRATFWAAYLVVTGNYGNEIKISDDIFNGVRVRIYKQQFIDVQDGAIIYIHGGGAVILGIDHYDEILLRLVKFSKRTVLSIDYRLAPEHPFPSAVDDCVAVCKYFLSNCHRLYSINPNKVSVMGDSAGAMLAAVMANKFSNSQFKFQSQILIYPWLQMIDFQSPSYQDYYKSYKNSALLDPEFAARSFLHYAGMEVTKERLEKVINNEHIAESARKSAIFESLDHSILPGKFKSVCSYSGPNYPRGDSELWNKVQKFVTNPDFSPLVHPDLSGTSPAMIVTVGYDVIRDDSVWYVEKLKKSKVKVEWHHYPNTIHGVFSFDCCIANDMMLKAVDFINAICE